MALLWSCRSEDLLTENKEIPQSKFRVFTSNNGEKVNYAEGFKILMEKHDSLNNEQHTAKAMENAFENSKTVSEEYIEFNIRSKDLISDTGERWIVYPVIKNSSVIGLIAGVLNKEETEVQFRRLISGNKYYDNVIPLFQEQYQKSFGSARQMNKNGKCGFPMQPPCEIDVIVITPPNSGSGGGPWIGGSGGEDPPKGCDKYQNCIHNDPGGGGGGNDGQLLDPCEKTKGIINNLKSKPAIDDMKNQSGLPASDPNSGEIGYKFKADGTPSEKIIGGAHSVNFGNKTGYAGGYHNHTTAGIPMLSVPDIDQLLGFARAQPTSNLTNVNNAFVGMIAPNGMHYVILFNGTYQDALTNFSQEQLDILADDFREREDKLTDFSLNGTTYTDGTGKITNIGVEKLFFETLKKMGLDGKVTLQRIESNGTTQNISLDNNNMPTAVPCP